jgi:hypothetical protein
MLIGVFFSSPSPVVDKMISNLRKSFKMDNEKMMIGY